MLQDYSKGLMIGLAVGFMIVPVILVSLRLWAKWLSARRMALDDHLAIAALFVSITCCLLQLTTAVHGHLGQHQPLYSDGTPIMDDPGLIFFEKTKFALNMLGIVGLGLIKASILIYYKNIFTTRPFRYAVYGMLTIITIWTAGYFFSHLFTCYPITVFIEPYYGNKCVNQVPMFLSVAISGTIIDCIILAMPIPVILGLQLPLKQRIAVMGILLLGAAVCAVSIARVIALFEVAGEYLRHPNDVIYYTAPVFFWINIELSLAVVSACLPTLRPIWTHFRPEVKRLPTHSSSGYASAGQDASKNSRLSRYRKYARTPYSELEELELTRNDDVALQPQDGIVREIRIEQTRGELRI
ncbi:hypothetical protein BDV95DRAFT_309446 [Massariosphaeria phaeospora]|uniref:Rhodopsin domain-containing protein n=1 Tax=Massariosphaeria phaeospora TaxID=100035 RepID=A0A7C8MCW0_9PLEO|nr:hypothetical protein BDV95DRAFT_309446 [Massariosphaeria phaeospora]